MAYKKILLEGDAAVVSNATPVNADFAAASAGTASDTSRSDHKHSLPDALASDIVAIDGGTASVGTANKVARADHKHPLGTLVANLNVGGNQLINALLENLAAAPTEHAGRIYFNTGDGHPYIGQVG